MKEWLTIFDEKGNILGKKLRDDVHREGDWHETFHCWLIERDDEDLSLYFQLRAHDKKDFPGKWDITSAGHIMHDEDLLTGGLREVEEELGLSFHANDFVYKGVYKLNNEHPPLIDHEMCHMYFHIVTSPLAFAPGDEVDDVMKLSATSFLQLLKGEQSSVTGTTLINDKEKPIAVTFEDIYPHEIEYYEFVVEQSRNMLKVNSL
ncbi:NUDIX domain-containing protein [Bacillus sp. DX4.1]|uniref:NUDIX hydrolase n=1 Tax=Bacillus sp. DX4.1 TaxID=3055867 RepID=UPI0025A20DE3|nr:NUDIX domain-containing protein [Bacillus sp. DX4.1]MDM5188218.1 NUDIX domain-containing protein [Bacillus sp. DX4.1]